MKIPIRRYQLALLLSLLALVGVSISAQRIWEIAPTSLKAKLQSFQRTARQSQSEPSKNRADSSTLTATAPALDPAQDRFNIPLYVIPGGGDASTDGRFNTTGAIGQAVLGSASDGGRFAATGGFWVAGGFQCSLTLSPASLPVATQGTAYNQTLTASGGTAPYTFSLSVGAPPTGVTLSPAGNLAGTPGSAGPFNFTIKVTDANNCAVERAYTLQVSPPTCGTITINPSTLPPGTVGIGYNQTFSAAGGNPTYTFSLTGNLPNGLSLSPGGTLAGTPTASGTFNFNVTATDSLNCTGSLPYTLVVNPPTPVNRIIRAIAASGAPGSPVIVPIELVSQGDEKRA